MADVDAIRAAIAAIADEAHSAARIRATLDAHARRHRQRRLVLRITGALAAAGTGGLAAYRLTRLDHGRARTVAGVAAGRLRPDQPRGSRGRLPDRLGGARLEPPAALW